MAKLIFRGLGISGYRSFGEEMQYSGEMGAVTLLAGKNNAGKSNFLRFLSMVTSGSKNMALSLGALDRPQTAALPHCKYAVAFPIDTITERSKISSNSMKRKLAEILSDPLLRKYDDDTVWLEFDEERRIVAPQFDDIISKYGTLSELATAVANHNVMGNDISRERMNAQIVFDVLTNDLRVPIPTTTIQSFRQIQPLTSELDKEGSHEGAGLLLRLQKLQNPAAERFYEDSKKFTAINQFLQNILDDDTARLEVQHDALTLNVHHAGKMLPLANLGTGIHQVVILAAAATILEENIVCMEEPEVHLHPVLQRKFIKYLANETSNQYVIATHSAHLLDYKNASIVHVLHDGITTSLTPALKSDALSSICADLGYRPSDLLQTNAIIWVEGPSDRIYLKHWIDQREPGLIEGIHYSIMFYGGGLLNQLTSVDNEITEFIKLRRLNRHLAIIIDSDKNYAAKPVNETKKRVQSEFDTDEGNGFAWITDGYTIENYVPVDILRSAVAEVHPGAAPLSWGGEKWTNPLRLTKIGPGANSMRPDKNKIARSVCDQWTQIPTRKTHLGKQIERCIEFIQTANIGIYHEL